MNTEELTRFYRSIEVGDDSVRNVLDATARRPVRRGAISWSPRRSQVFALTAALLLVLIAGLIYGSWPSGNDRPAPVGHSSTPTTAPARPSVRVPTERPNAVSGAVVDKDRPVSDAYVSVMLQPNGSIEDRLKTGQTLPTRNLPVTQTDSRGGFVVAVSKSDIVNRRFREGPFINFEIDVSVGNHLATYGGTFRIRNETAAPIQMIFDFGAKTVQVNGGRKQQLTIF